MSTRNYVITGAERDRSPSLWRFLMEHARDVHFVRNHDAWNVVVSAARVDHDLTRQTLRRLRKP